MGNELRYRNLVDLGAVAFQAREYMVYEGDEGSIFIYKRNHEAEGWYDKDAVIDRQDASYDAYKELLAHKPSTLADLEKRLWLID